METRIETTCDGGLAHAAFGRRNCYDLLDVRYAALLRQTAHAPWKLWRCSLPGQTLGGVSIVVLDVKVCITSGFSWLHSVLAVENSRLLIINYRSISKWIVDLMLR
jgi:hypothetical protein